MKLSTRLKAICDLIPNSTNVIDIGADHAYTCIYLEKEKNCKCLATDISKEAIKKAKENIKKYNSNVKTLKTDGLNNIKLDNQIIIISGMGTHNIMKILNKKITNDIIISSHTNIPIVRKFMFKKGFHIYKEKVIKEKKFYVITYYKYGKKKTNSTISPFLIENKNYMKYLYDHYKLKLKYEKKYINKIKYKLITTKIKKIINNY